MNSSLFVNCKRKVAIGAFVVFQAAVITFASCALGFFGANATYISDGRPVLTAGAIVIEDETTEEDNEENQEVIEIEEQKTPTRGPQQDSANRMVAIVLSIIALIVVLITVFYLEFKMRQNKY